MKKKQWTRSGPVGVVAVGLAGALALSTQSTAAPGDPSAASAARPRHSVVVSGLDNPRQLTALPGGKLLVAEAGHGASDPSGCVGEGEEVQCVGNTGRVSVVDARGRRRTVMSDLLSAAGPDGSFAVGSDGAAKVGSTVYSIITWGPPEMFPDGVSGKQSGKLLRTTRSGGTKVLADVSAYEFAHDVDGEGVESNPYAVLALGKDRLLVADAAGDYIAKVDRKGKVRVWAKMKEYGKKVDAVPTTLAEGPDGKVYVGELHSELPGKARVWRYSRTGKPLRSWKGFTTVTGVAVAKDGTLYVSELFGGDCGFDQIPTCFPGHVVRVKPNGKRTSIAVPFPAGVAVQGKKVYVNAFSVSPSTGFAGEASASGQIWRIFR